MGIGRAIKQRGWRVLQLVGVVLLIGAGLATGLGAVSAGAAGPTSGSVVPGSAVPGEAFTADTPFSSGQEIDVQIPANSLFTSNENINILECSAPGGVVPTDPGECDGNSIQGVTLKPYSDGSIDLHAEKNTYYPVFALPDSISLGESPGGPECDLKTECILYIGLDQNDFTQNHVWSQPFYVAPNTDDQGENPGDGSAPPPPAVPSAALSTLTASAPTAAADGVDTDTITATLLATGGIPVAGRTVALSQGAGHSVIVPASGESNVTNDLGQATFTVTDSTPEQLIYSATDTTDSIAITQTAPVAFQAPVVSPAHSSLVASPPGVPADGTTAATLTVTLRDQGAEPQPVAGKTVTITPGTGDSTITPASPGSDVTDTHGVATFAVTDGTVESVNYSATDTTDSIALAGTAEVTFGTLAVSGTASTVSSVSPAEVGGVGTSLTVTLLTSKSDPVIGKTVSVTASSGTASVAAASPGSDVTGANGEATFTVTDSVPEPVTFSANDATDSIAITQTTQVLFQAPAASPTTSTISAGSTTEPADGETKVGIQVVIKDQFGQPLSGQTVTIEGSPDPESSLGIAPIAIGSSSPGVTDSTGTAQFDADDTNASTVTFTATDATSGVVLHKTVQVTFQAADPDANKSSVVASPTSVPSDGSTTSTVTATLNDHFGNPISGRTITLSATNGNSTVTPAHTPNVTGADGRVTFTVADSTPEVVGYNAVDTTDNLQLSNQAVVTFGTPPVPPPVSADCDVVAGPQSVAADGSTASTITVMLYDANSNAVPGQTVTLTPSGGSSVVTAASANAGGIKGHSTATSGTNGTASFTVTDTTPETVTYTATDTSQTPPIQVGQLVTVTFTAVQATGTTTTTAPTTTTTTTAPIASSTTTSTTTGSALPAAGTSNGSSSASGGGSSTGSGGSAGASLAFTGAPTLLPWLLGLGLVLLLFGSIGRRLAARASR